VVVIGNEEADVVEERRRGQAEQRVAIDAGGAGQAPPPATRSSRVWRSEW
jgi:hypothetical protein